MPKSRKLRSSRKSRSLKKRGGNACKKCSVCNVEMKYKSYMGEKPYCICPKCARSYVV